MTERYGQTKVSKIRAAFNDLRDAVRAGRFEEAEAALDRYEPWADYVFNEGTEDDRQEADAGRPDGVRDGAVLSRLRAYLSFAFILAKRACFRGYWAGRGTADGGLSAPRNRL